MSSASSQSSTRASLLSLPPELRNIIYENVLVYGTIQPYPRVIPKRRGCLPDCYPGGDDDARGHVPTCVWYSPRPRNHLSAVCRQTHLESNGILYGHNRFVFPCYSFLQRFIQDLQPAHIQSIRAVEVPLSVWSANTEIDKSCFALLQNFHGLEELHTSTGYLTPPPPPSKLVFRDVLELTKDLKSLGKIVLHRLFDNAINERLYADSMQDLDVPGWKHSFEVHPSPEQLWETDTELVETLTLVDKSLWLESMERET